MLWKVRVKRFSFLSNTIPVNFANPILLICPAIEGVAFEHLIYHFVLTYSNWETGTIYFSESFESLARGLQNALWEIGGVPQEHQSDRLSAAVNKMGHPEEFTRHYSALLTHYGLKGRKTQAGHAHENGDAEQSHNRFKNAVEQALMSRGNQNFSSREEDGRFLCQLLSKLNSGRQERLKEEVKYLSLLSSVRLDECKKKQVHVGSGSTMKILWLAAYETEEGVDRGLRVLLERQDSITAQSLENLVKSNREVSSAMDVQVSDVDLTSYDELLDSMEVWPCLVKETSRYR